MKIKTNVIKDLGKFAEECSRNELLEKSKEGTTWFTFLFILGVVTSIFNMPLGLMIVLLSIPCIIQAKYLSTIAYLKKIEEDEK